MPRPHRPGRPKRRTLAYLARLALAAGALLSCPPIAAAGPEAGAPDGLLVRRRVVAPDVVVPPAVIGSMPGGRSCPSDVGDAVDGDEIRLWVTPAAARRDEPGWSAILRLEAGGKGVVHLLFHADRAFTTLRYPVPQKRFWNEMRQAVEEAGEGKFFALTPQGEVARSHATAGGVAVEERRLTILDGFGHRWDFELQLEPGGELAAVAFALEALVQAIRQSGDDWLPMTGAATGVPVGLAVTAHGPETRSRYAEELVARERQPIPADRFTVPAGYSEVPFVPECF